MRFSSVLVIFATVFTYVNAVPVTSRQGAGDIGCPGQDDNGTGLTGARDPNAEDDNAGGLVCKYQGAGSCRFFADGTFSSGASACPQGLVAGGTKSLADTGAGSDAAPSSAAASPSAEPPATSAPAPAAPSSSSPAAVVPPTSTSTVAVPPTTSSSAVASTPSSSKAAVPTSESSSASPAATSPAQGNAALPGVQQRPVMLVTIFGIAAGALMAF